MTKENKRQVGTKYEKLAGAFLEKQGYDIVCYNYRCFFGEIDIIAREGSTIVFCEVKYRRTLVGGSPFEAVDPRKQQIIYKCAMNYLSFEDAKSEIDHDTYRNINSGSSRGMYEREISYRFDVIGFVGDEICHVKNAFQG
jgi:putative endonuclease